MSRAKRHRKRRKRPAASPESDSVPDSVSVVGRRARSSGSVVGRRAPSSDSVSKSRPAKAYASFWFGLAISAPKLWLFRVLFFGVLAIDAWLQIEHAPRYGAGDFNVGQFPALDFMFPEPSRSLMLGVFILQAYLAARIMLGDTRRGVLIALTALFGYSYFVSQLDSYQHHYLVFLLLVCTCFVYNKDKTLGWPIRLILVEISIVYVWAAISKMDPLWLDGRTMHAQASAPWLRDLIESWFGKPTGPGDLGGWAVAAKLVIALELALAAAIHIRYARVIALVVGIGFHLGIEFAGFRIGLFSYFMVAIYVLLIPDRWLMFVANKAREAWEPIARGWRAWEPGRITVLALTAGAIGAGTAMVIVLPFDSLAAVAGAIALIGCASYVLGPRTGRIGARRAAIHLGACLALLPLAQFTDTARDHHRFWGGSLRRLGDLEQATTIYERAVAIDPDYAPGHTSLGNLYRRTGHLDDALISFNRALALAPDDWRPNLGAALVYDLQGDGPRAAAAARRALVGRPGEPDAQRILRKWQDASP